MNTAANQSPPTRTASKKRISISTLGYGIFIVSSAAFMQQVWSYLEKLIGKGELRASCLQLSLAIAGVWVSYQIIRRRETLKIIVGAAILSLAFWFAVRQSTMVEKMHVLEYGFLGWLALRDLHKLKPSFKPFLYAFLFVALISIADESFQTFLPYRYGDLRDVKLDIISGLFGIALYSIK